jgi:membrane-bound ClpP family serine protease
MATSTLRERSESADGSGPRKATKEQIMSIGTILLVVLILMLVGVLPIWPHASSWGYGPSGIVGVILIVIIVLFLMGRL